LYHLGAYFGNKLVGHYGEDPEGNCGFEAANLMSICEESLRFPGVELTRDPKWIENKLRWWVDSMRRNAPGTVASGKYPQLVALWPQLKAVCDDLYVVNCDRPVEDAIASVMRRNDTFGANAELRERHQLYLDNCRTRALRDLAPERILNVRYYALLADPESVIRNDIVPWLLRVYPEGDFESKVGRAVRHVDPEMQHIGVANL
jgi:hypothetical protein